MIFVLSMGPRAKCSPVTCIYIRIMNGGSFVYIEKVGKWTREMSAWYTVHVYEYVYSGIVYQCQHHPICLRYNQSPYNKD